MDKGKSFQSSKILYWGATGLGLILLAGVGWIFYRTLHQYDIHEVTLRLKGIPFPRLIWAGVFTLLSYLCQAGYETLGAASLKSKLGLRRVFLAALVGNGITNTTGFPNIFGTSIRLRFFLTWGTSILVAGQIIVLAKLAFFTGLTMATAGSQIVDPVDLASGLSLPLSLSPRVLGSLLLLPPLAFFCWLGFSKHRFIQLGKIKVAKPALWVVVLQMLFSSLHFVFAAFALYFLLPAEALLAAGFSGPISMISSFMAIKAIIAFVPIPGGLGILETMAVKILTPALPVYPLLAALIAFRMLYYVLPFTLATISLAAFEVISGRGLLAIVVGAIKSRKRP